MTNQGAHRFFESPDVAVPLAVVVEASPRTQTTKVADSAKVLGYIRYLPKIGQNFQLL